jgi:hypothetical protein
VSIIPEGIRYRDTLNEIKIKTGENGAFEVEWPTAGMYWLNVSIEDEKTTVPEASSRRASYTVTLEVLPQ